MARKFAREVGQRLRARRLELGLSQGQVAEKLPPKIDAQRISKWERGENMPGDENLELLAAALGVSVAYFHSREPERTTGDLMGRMNGDRTQLDRIEKMLSDLLSRLGDQPADELFRALVAQEVRLVVEQTPVPHTGKGAGRPGTQGR